MKNYIITLLMVLLFVGNALSQAFVHPGGLHTQADLDRMKTKVAEGAHPWIEGWNALIQDPLAQNTYVASPRANMGSSRQVASKDAHAAYLNAIRWYVSGDVSYADCAIRILNGWSSAVDQIPSGGEFVGLGGIAIAEFAMAAEVMRISSRWQSSDFNRFKSMMINYLYPVCHDFLTNHNGRCIQYYWANWDANNIMALIAIGVLCDNSAIFNEGVNYFQNGGGTGSIMNAVPFVHAGNLGQWQEAGRDQTHGFLGVGFLATACQIAWNQGVDLYGYDNNRLLAGAEYVAKYNLWEEVPFSTYDNCQDVNHDWPAINGRGVFHDRPVYEMIYNHYVVRRGIHAPYTQKMAEIMRPERGSIDHFGYGTLTFTHNPSTLPVHPVPPAPANVIATAGTGKVFVKWQPSAGNTVRGYQVQRATSSGGPYTTVVTWDGNTSAQYTDTGVANGTTYYYRVAGINRAGTGANSGVSNAATPMATGSLPSGWSKAEIGSHNAGSAGFANVSGGTYVVNGYGTGVGGTADNVTYVYRQATGDGTITGRISNISGTLAKTGLMIRETLNADAKAVAMTLGEGGWRFARMGHRTATGASMGSTLGNTYTWVPAWFRITRSGNTFTAYESSNGTTWFQVGSATVSMTSSYFIGLVVTSGNATAQNTTTFDNVAITGSGGTCTPTSITPVLRVDGGSWQTTTSITINSGQQIQFGPQPVTGGSWSWSGCGTSGSSREQTVSPTSTCSATATYTNSCGTQSSVTYNITVNSSSLGGSTYQLRNRSTGLYLDGMGRTTNGSACGQWANTSSTNAQWEIQEYNGNYSIQNVATDLFLDGMGRTSNGEDVGQWDNVTNTNAQWSIQQYDGDYYRIRNISTALYLDGAGRTTNGDACGQWANTSSPNAQWELIPVSSAARIAASGARDELLEAESLEEESVQFYPNPGSSVLTLRLPKEFGNGTVKFLDLSGKLALEANLSSEKPEVNVATLTPGVYVLKIKGRGAKVWSEKFVKEQ